MYESGLNDAGVRRKARLAVPRLLCGLGLAVGLFAAPSLSWAAANCPTSPVDNDDLTLGCGKDIILILDESRSIAAPTDNRDLVVAAARAFVESLVGTGSRVALVEFGTQARFVALPNQTPGAYVPVRTDTLPDFSTYLSNTLTLNPGEDRCDTTLDPARYGPFDEAAFVAGCLVTGLPPINGDTDAIAGLTNWEGAFRLANTINSIDQADLVIVLTDGNPTVTDAFRGNGNFGFITTQCSNNPANTGQSAACIGPAEIQAASVKAGDPGAHVLMVYVDDDAIIPAATENNLQAVSGCDPLLSPFTVAEFNQADYSISVSFAALADGFRQAALALCASSLTVTKAVVSGEADPVLTPDVLFRADVTLDAPATSDDYEWIDPPVAGSCPGNNIPPSGELGLGCPGPGLAGTIGTTQWGRTDNQGVLTFDWVPGTEEIPTEANATVELREFAQEQGLNYRILSCIRTSIDPLTGDETISAFQCDSGVSTCTSLIEPTGVDACAGVSCGVFDGPIQDPPTQTPLQLGVGAGDIVACEVLNEEQELLPDFGDAPDSYGTTLASGGARHLPDPQESYRLGTQVDFEVDAWTPLNGTGDDANGSTPDDEDGVTFQSFSGPGFPIQATVTGGTGANPGYLCAYLDGAADGTIDGQFARNITYSDNSPPIGLNLTGVATAGNEEICVVVQGTAASASITSTTDIAPVAGFNGANATCNANVTTGAFTCTIRFNPNFTTAQTTYARFRLTSDLNFDPLSVNSPSPIGEAADGEVEDYRIDVQPTAVTMGSVDLEAESVSGFIDGLDTQAMSNAELLDLLMAWDPAAAEALRGADRQAILDALRAYLDPDGDGQVAVLRWDTLEQHGTIGFYVDRRADGGDWVRINGDMLPALMGAPLGGEYRLADPTARAGERYEYQLLEQEATGSTRTYGPFSLEVSQ